jgi:hypothetical protein
MPVELHPGGGEIKPPRDKGGRYEEITDSNPLPPTHPLYSVPIQTVDITYPDHPDRGPREKEYRFGKFGRVKFQKGLVKDGINGIGVEHLLHLVAKKLTQFQMGEHKCGENQHALENVAQALDWLKRRMDQRLNIIAREGTDGDS